MSKKLLLADDSITIQKVIQITFAHEDYELTMTDNGDAALVKAREIIPDLVMADVYMPGKNGYELAAAIKHDPALRHIPVLLLAGSFEPFDEQQARSCQADAWIEKPFESQSLIDKVAELLSAAPAASSPPAGEAPPAAPREEPGTLAPAAAQEDHFGDISFEEEAPPATVRPAAAADVADWGDVVLDEPADLAVQTAAEFVEDFSFVEEAPAAAEGVPAAQAAAAGQADLAVFDMDEEEIMCLDDDDILDSEDLEPIMEEQTLAPWSRVAVDREDVFAAADEEDIFVAAVQEDAFVAEDEEDIFVAEDQEDAFAAADQAEALAEAPGLQAESAPFAQADAGQPAPGVLAVAAAEAETRVAALSEAELERIVEKVVTKIVAQLADAILEKVAWEVVPDLAESLIRAEIRKIKDAAA